MPAGWSTSGVAPTVGRRCDVDHLSSVGNVGIGAIEPSKFRRRRISNGRNVGTIAMSGRRIPTLSSIWTGDVADRVVDHDHRCCHGRLTASPYPAAVHSAPAQRPEASTPWRAQAPSKWARLEVAAEQDASTSTARARARRPGSRFPSVPRRSPAPKYASMHRLPRRRVVARRLDRGEHALASPRSRSPRRAGRARRTTRGSAPRSGAAPRRAGLRGAGDEDGAAAGGRGSRRPAMLGAGGGRRARRAGCGAPRAPGRRARRRRCRGPRRRKITAARPAGSSDESGARGAQARRRARRPRRPAPARNATGLACAGGGGAAPRTRVVARRAGQRLRPDGCQRSGSPGPARAVNPVARARRDLEDARRVQHRHGGARRRRARRADDRDHLRVGHRVAQREGGPGRRRAAVRSRRSSEVDLVGAGEPARVAERQLLRVDDVARAALARLRQQRVDVQRGADDVPAAGDRLRRGAAARRRERGEQRGRRRRRRLIAASGRARRGVRPPRGSARAGLEHLVGRARLAARVDERGVPARQLHRGGIQW